MAALASNASATHCWPAYIDFDAQADQADRREPDPDALPRPAHPGVVHRWDTEAARAVASLRLVAGRHRDDRELADLVGELIVKSDEFASLWSQHPVHNCQSGVKRFQHAEVGAFEAFEFEVLHLPDDSGHRILTADADTSSTRPYSSSGPRSRRSRKRHRRRCR